MKRPNQSSENYKELMLFVIFSNLDLIFDVGNKTKKNCCLQGFGRRNAGKKKLSRSGTVSVYNAECKICAVWKSRL